MLVRSKKELENYATQVEKEKTLLRDAIRNAYDLGKHDQKDKERTLPQNNALHLYCSKLAKAMNDAGLTMQQVLKPGIDIEWTTESVKKYMWHPVQRFLFNKESTAQLEKHEPGQIHEHLNRFLSNNLVTCGLDHIPFPSKEHKKEPAKNYPTENNDPEAIPF